MRDLICRDQDRTAMIANMQEQVTEGMNSGVGNHSMNELREIAHKRVAGTQ
jgi:antitoxin ParD1/3/4